MFEEFEKVRQKENNENKISDVTNNLKNMFSNKKTEDKKVDLCNKTDIENNLMKMFPKKPAQTVNVPAVATRKDQKKKCWNCHAFESEELELLKCGGCKKARYCDQECQEQDWDRHQEHCPLIQQKKINKKC